MNVRENNMKLRRALTMLLCSTILYVGPLYAQNVVTEWNDISRITIVSPTKGNRGPGPSSVWFAYVHIAEYDAVNAIVHRFQPFYFNGSAPAGTSLDAAVIAAAHRVLVFYFPAFTVELDADYNQSLDKITDSPGSISSGIATGEASAAALINARAGDGLAANVPYIPGHGPGVWQPTPPAFLPAAAPWVGQMRPFTLSSASQFLPDGPTKLNSEEWEHDYKQTRILGDANSTVRTSSQTEIGLFWTENTSQQYARAFTYLAENYKLSVPDSVRLMAILWTGYADSIIGCFNAKYQYSFWRPVAAIPAGGGNSELTPFLNWTPLGITPNHPEYPAAHGCVTSTVSHLIRGYFGTSRVRIVVDSLVFQDGIHTHTFVDTRDLFREVFWARIYAGFHFHHSLVDGGTLGKEVARQLLREHFRSLRDKDDEDDDDRNLDHDQH